MTEMIMYDLKHRPQKIDRTQNAPSARASRITIEDFESSSQYTLANLNLLPKKETASFGLNSNLKLTTYKQSEVRKIVKEFKKEGNQKKIVDISQQLYATSTQYRRLINHFAGMLLYCPVITPVKDLKKVSSVDKIKKQYQEIGELINKMNFSSTFRTQHRLGLIEDVVFGWVHETDESFFIQNFDYQICKISSIEDGVFNFAMDMSYFDTNKEKLDFMPKEVISIYKKWKRKKDNNNQISDWAELPSEKTFCIKVSDEMLETFPFFSGVFDSIYDVEAFKLLRKDSAELANYMAIVQKLPMRDKTGDNNDFLLDVPMYTHFTNVAQEMVPDNVGVFTTPMDIDTVQFDKKQAGDDGVEKATKDVWNDSGISSVLFNTEASSTTQGLSSSIKTDEELVFITLSQMNRWLNRYLKFKYGKKLIFNVNLLNITEFNQKEKYDMYLGAGQYGLPVKSHIASILGLKPIEVMSMAFLENDLLEMHNEFIPLQSSHTMSGDSEENNTSPSSTDKDSGGREKLPENERSSETERNDTKPSAVSKA